MNEPSGGRITLNSLIVEAVHGISHIETGLRRTLVALLINPGKMLCNYLEGERSGYQKPFGFLLLATTIYAIVLHFTHLAVHLPHQLPANADFNSRLAFNAANLETGYYSWLHIGLLPFYGLFAMIIFFRSKYNYAEWLVICCYVVSFLLLLLIPYQLIDAMVDFNETTNFIVQILIVVIYSGYALAKMDSKNNLLSVFKGALFSAVVFTFFYYVVRGIAYYITWRG